MKCRVCGHSSDRIVGSFACDSDTRIRRKRMCVACGARFTTYETFAYGEGVPPVVKRSGEEVPYDREKVLGGMLAACHKLGDVRPEDIETAARQIHGKLVQRVNPIQTSEIGELVLEKLQKLSPTGCARFLCVFAGCRTPGEMVEAIRKCGLLEVK